MCCIKESICSLKQLTVASLSDSFQGEAQPRGLCLFLSPTECREHDLCMSPNLDALLAACMTLINYLTSMNHYFLICEMGPKYPVWPLGVDQSLLHFLYLLPGPQPSHLCLWELPPILLGPKGASARGVLGWWRRPMVRSPGATLVPLEAHIQA